jgi:hypothetical protein
MRKITEHVSTMIQSSSYDTITGDLLITFQGGNQYNYYMVTEQDYQEFIGSESIGQGFNAHIRKYEGVKLVTEDKQNEEYTQING